jgi:hypothetical protein
MAENRRTAAFLPLVPEKSDAQTDIERIAHPVKKGQIMYAFLFLAVFTLLLGLAGQFGWVHDSRDGADWRATDAGVRATR